MSLLQRNLGLAWLSITAASSMVMEAERSTPYETGGILMGYWVKPCREAVIVRAIGPGPEAVHTPRGFSPDGRFHELEVAAEYYRSNRQHTYLGDWHSHPEGGANLSPKDRSTLKRIAVCKGARVSHPVMAVLSHEGSWTASIWLWKPTTLFLARLGWHHAMRTRIYDDRTN